MKKVLISALLLSQLLASNAMAASLPSAVEVTQAAKLQQQGVFLLDVGEPYEFAEVHAKGATLVPLGHLSERLNELQAYKNKPIAVICRSGRRSAQGVQILQQAGFTQVTNVIGGTTAWESAGLPVEHQ